MKHWFIAFFLAVAIMLLIVYGRPANAQARPGSYILCMKAGIMLELLPTKFKEKLEWSGVSVEGTLLQLHINDTRPSWSITEQDGSGRACLPRVGKYFEFVKTGKPI